MKFELVPAIKAFFTTGLLSAVVGVIYKQGSKAEALKSFQAETTERLKDGEKHFEAIDTKLAATHELLTEIKANQLSHQKSDDSCFKKIDDTLNVIISKL